MLTSILVDAYHEGEKKAIADAIRHLCHPPGQKIFSRVGLYCYWDFRTRDILYLGLSGDLYKRFRQHNGLIACQANCCKREKIDEYFKANETMGFSLILQSKMQDDGVLEKFDDWMLEELIGFSDATKNVAFAEGNLIRAHAERYGNMPPWNKNKASKEGDGAPTLLRGSGFDATLLEEITGKPPEKHHFDMLTDLVGKSFSPLVARNTIREVKDYRTEVTEDMMHGVRMLMLSERMTYEQAAVIQKARQTVPILELLEAEGYLARTPSIFK